MRDFRDAKAMAHVLREQISLGKLILTRSESLELVAKMFGLKDWNTLSAAIKGDQRNLSRHKSARRTLPAFPIRDVTPFPGIEMPFWLRRPETIKALKAALAGGRGIVLLTQRTMDVESPALADVYSIGVTGRVLDICVPSPDLLAKTPRLERATQVLVQTHERVGVRAFSASASGFEAEVEDVLEGPMNANSDLIHKAMETFAHYASKHPSIAAVEARLRRARDVGRIADMIAQSVPMTVEDKQVLLGQLDPVERLEAVLTHLRAA